VPQNKFDDCGHATRIGSPGIRFGDCGRRAFSAGFAEQPTAAGQKATTKGPVVFAAASMKTALDAVAAAWTAETGKTPPIVYTSSAVLAKQIEQAHPPIFSSPLI